MQSFLFAPGAVLGLLLPKFQLLAIIRSPSKLEIEPPSLFDNSSKSSCPEADPKNAALRARDAERAATAKQQRFSFDLSDGIAAVPLWRQAQSCYLTAGDDVEATRVLGQVTHWVVRLDERYATLRFQLSRALESDRNAEALSAVGQLQSLFAKREPGPYQRWLERLRQSLQRHKSK